MFIDDLARADKVVSHLGVGRPKRKVRSRHFWRLLIKEDVSGNLSPWCRGKKPQRSLLRCLVVGHIEDLGT